MTLANTLGGRLRIQSESSELSSPSHSHTTEATSEKLQAAYWASEAVGLALRATRMLENYRSVYGLKAVLPFIFQASVTTAFVLLGRSSEESGHQRPSEELHSVGAFDEPVSGFEESLRCLLGTATQVGIARGVATMILKTAKVMGTELPASIMRLPQTVAEIAWGTQNVRSISSSYPNYALVAAKEGRPEGLTMEELLQKWSSLTI